MSANWKEFSSSATVHGIRFINKDSSLKRRVIWGILVLVSAGFLLWQVYQTSFRFFQFKVNTVVHLTNDGKTKFPAITICNTNTLRKSKLNEPRYKNDSRVKVLMELSREVFFSANFTAQKKNNSAESSLSGKELLSLISECGHNFKWINEGGMLKECLGPTYGVCNSSDFTKYVTYTGNCFTLNGDLRVNRGFFASASGRFSSVTLEVSIQMDEHTLSLGSSLSAGIHVLVHDQLDPPFADTHGFLIGPGVHASIAIKKTKIQSMKQPYESNCRDEPLSGRIPYSRLACLRMCQENFIIKTCKCKMPVDTIIERYDVPLCNATQMYSCGIHAATRLLPAQKNECGCPFACQSIEYTTRISQAPYPKEPLGREQAVIDLKKLNKNITEENIQKRLKFYKNNMVLLDFFYEKLDYLTIKQVPEYDFVGLIAAVGGLLGISLGASLLTVIEVLDYVVFTFLRKLYLKRSQINAGSCVEMNDAQQHSLDNTYITSQTVQK